MGRREVTERERGVSEVEQSRKSSRSVELRSGRASEELEVDVVEQSMWRSCEGRRSRQSGRGSQIRCQDVEERRGIS